MQAHSLLSNKIGEGIYPHKLVRAVDWRKREKKVFVQVLKAREVGRGARWRRYAQTDIVVYPQPFYLHTDHLLSSDGYGEGMYRISSPIDEELCSDRHSRLTWAPPMRKVCPDRQSRLTWAVQLQTDHLLSTHGFSDVIYRIPSPSHEDVCSDRHSHCCPAYRPQSIRCLLRQT